MSDFSSWSLQLGRWFQMHVRVHALFVATAVFAVFLSTSHQADAAAYGALSVAILFLSVLAHEFGHCAAAARVGGACERITIGPLGGFGHPEVPRESQAELITAFAGPLVNLGILLVTVPFLVAANVAVPPLLNPLAPTGLIDGGWWEVSAQAHVLDQLAAVDGKSAAGLSVRRRANLADFAVAGARTSRRRAGRGSRLEADSGSDVRRAWMLRDTQSADVLPAWVPLLLFAAYIWFSAQHEWMRLETAEWDDELFSYDFSQGYTSLERASEPPRAPSSSMRRWLENRREQRQRRRQWIEQEEERQVDEILVRLHETGMNSLSGKERALLNRVSARFRNRQRS